MARPHKVRSPLKEEAISDTVGRLGINVDESDTGLIPPMTDEMRLDAAAAEPNLGPLGEPDDEDDIPVQVPPPKSSLRTSLFEAPKPAPVPTMISAPPPPPPPPLNATPLAFQEIALPVSAPGERPAKKAKLEVVPSLRKLGAGLAKKLPGAERVQVHKRDRQTGSLGYIGEYNMRDLSTCADIETFLHRYVKPIHGAGEYTISATDGSGSKMELAPVTLLDPIQPNAESGLVGLVKELVEQNRNPPPAPAPQNPIDLLRGMMQVSKEMQPTPAPAPAPAPDMMGPLAAVIQAQGQQTMAMMQMMQAQNQQTMQMFMGMFQSQSSGKSDPLPPPPPPEPKLDWDMILKALPLVLGVLRPKDDTKELLMAMLTDAKAQSLSPRDTISLLQEMRPQTNGSEDFRKSLENLSMIMQVAQNLRGGQEPQSTGFFDAIGALITNQDFVGNIGAAIRKRADAAAISVEAKARKELIIEAAKARPVMNAQNPVVDQRMTPPPGAAQVASAPSAPQQAQQAQQQLPPFPPLPEKTADHLNAIVEAKDDPDRIQQMVALLAYFAGYNEWRPFTTKIFEVVKAGDKQQALGMLNMLLRHFIRMQLLPVAEAEKIFAPFEKYFPMIVEHVRGEASQTSAPDPVADPFGAALAAADEEVEEEEEEAEDGDEMAEGDEEEDSEEDADEGEGEEDEEG